MKKLSALFSTTKHRRDRYVRTASALNNDVTRQFARAGVMFWR